MSRKKAQETAEAGTLAEAVEAEESKKKVAKPEPVEEKRDLMYVGPTIIGVVHHSTTYKDGVFTDAIEQKLAEYPAMRRLFVPLEELSEAIKQLNKKQSALGAVYAQTARKFTRRM